MMKRIYLFLALAAVGMCAMAQERSCGLWLNEVPVVADTSEIKMYVTLEPEADRALKGTLKWDETRFQKVALNGAEVQKGMGNFALTDWSDATTNTLMVTDAEGKETIWTLAFTTLPIILLEANQSDLYEIWKKDNDVKTRSFITVIDARFRNEGECVFSSDIGIRVRGATSAGKEKKSFAVELRDENGEERDFHLLGYRNDGDWILDAMYNDASRMRNRINFDLWNSVSDLPYDKDNDYQRNGTDGEYVEVFMEGKYWGMYCFTDKIDRKKLNLKKLKEASGSEPETLRGLLWKSTFRCSATTFYGYDAYPTNDTLIWEDYWEQKYPDDRQDQAYFNPIADMIDKLLRNQTDNNLVDSVAEMFYLDNIIDYVIFSQAFQWMDNLQKNMYLSVRNLTKGDKILYTPWDLDAVLGRSAGGDALIDDKKWMAFGEQLGGINNLIYRLTHMKKNTFATLLNNRWQYLKKHQLSLETVRMTMEKYADIFNYSGAWNREYARWGRKMAKTTAEEIDFMMDFLIRNYEVFDNKVASWKPDEYIEPAEVSEKVMYIVGTDSTVDFEGNTAIVPGRVIKEDLTGVEQIDFEDNAMIIHGIDGDRVYTTDDMKEALMEPGAFYPTTAFVPETYSNVFDFDTQYGCPGVEDSTAYAEEPYSTQRTLKITFDDYSTATIVGNTQGIIISNTANGLEIYSPIEGMNYELSGENKNTRLTIGGDYAAKVTLNNADLAYGDSAVIVWQSDKPLYVSAKGKNEISGILSVGDVRLSGTGVLNIKTSLQECAAVKSEKDIYINGGVINIFSDAFDGKGLWAAGTLTMNAGNVHIITTGSGTAVDDALGILGTKAVFAEKLVNIKDGSLFVKTHGKDGGLGIASLKKVLIEGGKVMLACFDDPINAVDAINITGGDILSTSMVDDGMDTNGSFSFSGGNIYAIGGYPNEAAFDNDGKTFSANGGTIIGIGAKSDYPQSSKSTQACVYIKKQKGIQRYVRIADADGAEVITFETPAYEKSTVVCSAPNLVKGQTYTILTGSNKDELIEWGTIEAK